MSDLVRGVYAGTYQAVTDRAVKPGDWVLVRARVAIDNAAGPGSHRVRVQTPSGYTHVAVRNEEIICLTDGPTPPEPSARSLLLSKKEQSLWAFKDSLWRCINDSADVPRSYTWEGLFSRFGPFREYQAGDEVG